VDSDFAHCYETDGMRRWHFRGRENILKRQLAHVSAFNLSLVMRQPLGAGIPWDLRNRALDFVLHLFMMFTYQNRPNSAIEAHTSLALDSTGSYRSIKPRCRTFWNSATYTTG
jgi:hypothetical protein